MGFKRFIQDFDKEYRDYILEDVKKQQKAFNGRRMISDGETNLLTYNSWDEKTLRLFTAYRNEVTTKRLVWATWGLAIGTLLLSGLTLYLTFFTGA